MYLSYRSLFFFSEKQSCYKQNLHQNYFRATSDGSVSKTLKKSNKITEILLKAHQWLHLTWPLSVWENARLQMPLLPYLSCPDPKLSCYPSWESGFCGLSERMGNLVSGTTWNGDNFFPVRTVESRKLAHPWPVSVVWPSDTKISYCSPTASLKPFPPH